MTTTVREYECGCKITSEKNYPSIAYCPLHKSAPDMYEALKAIMAASTDAGVYEMVERYRGVLANTEV